MIKGTSLVLLATLLLPAAAAAQHRDPLTEKESNQLRDSNYEPEKRIKLFLDFAKARLLAIDQLRGDPKPAAERGQRIRDLLEDFGNIMDELGDNLDMYTKERHNDIRKSLKEVIAADEEFQLRLRALQQGGGPEAKDYQVTLEDASDALAGNADTARQMLDDQEAAAGAKKREKSH